LPSTAEWEFAARLGGLAEGMYSSGNSVYVLKNYEVNYQNSKGEIQNIGTKLPFFYNGKPIYDLGGHIFVWVEDRDSGITKLSSKNLSQTNLNNINSTKKVRGGNYKSINNWFVIGNAYNRDQGSRYNDVGFRLVRSVEE
jgi:formylglycine-generating enzyme required for sulfatase activity